MKEQPRKKYLSKCCKKKVFLIGGRIKVDADLMSEYEAKIPPGQTCYYECSKCQNPCDTI